MPEILAISPPFITTMHPMDRLDELLDQLADLDDGDASVAAISLLESEASVEWLPRLYELLATAEDCYIREGVAPAIIRLEGAAALPQLVKALRLGFDEGFDCDSLQANVSDLITTDPVGSAAILLPLADSTDPADRADAAWLLDYAHEEVPPEVFLRLASDASPLVRKSACGSLGSLEGYEPAFQMLVQRLDDPDEDVRLAAANSLGYFNDVRALPLLERRLAGSKDRECTHLEFAISRLRKRSN